MPLTPTSNWLAKIYDVLSVPGGAVATPVTLLTDAAATGAAQAWPGGIARWAIFAPPGGDWDGATAQRQMRPQGASAWQDVDLPVTEDDVLTTFDGAAPGDELRVVITNAGTSTSISSTAVRTG